MQRLIRDYSTVVIWWLLTFPANVSRPELISICQYNDDSNYLKDLNSLTLKEAKSQGLDLDLERSRQTPNMEHHVDHRKLEAKAKILAFRRAEAKILPLRLDWPWS